MRHPIRKFATTFVAVALLLSLTGCDKIGKEDIARLEAASLAAKERAKTFDLMIPLIRAIDPNHEPSVEVWAQAHLQTLQIEAKSLSDLKSAATKWKFIQTVTKKNISEMALTAAGDAKATKRMIKYLRHADNTLESNAKIQAWLTEHQACLDSLAQALEKINAAVQKIPAVDPPPALVPTLTAMGP